MPPRGSATSARPSRDNVMCKCATVLTGCRSSLTPIWYILFVLNLSVRGTFQATYQLAGGT